MTSSGFRVNDRVRVILPGSAREGQVGRVAQVNAEWGDLFVLFPDDKTTIHVYKFSMVRRLRR